MCVFPLSTRQNDLPFLPLTWYLQDGIWKTSFLLDGSLPSAMLGERALPQNRVLSPMVTPTVSGGNTSNRCDSAGLRLPSATSAHRTACQVTPPPGEEPDVFGVGGGGVGGGVGGVGWGGGVGGGGGEVEVFMMRVGTSYRMYISLFASL